MIETTRLHDGRVLAYSEYGDPRGRPLIWCHGGGSSRLDAAPLDAPAQELGIRVLSPDRPGVGGSDPLPARRLMGWPGDALALADALGLDSLLAAGWSAGGPYALALAHAAPERVERVALLASAVPFEVAGSRRDLNRPDRVMLVLSAHARPLAGALLRLTVGRPSAPRLQRVMERGLTDADAAAMRAEGPPEVAVGYVKEAIRNGKRGVVDDYRVFGAPWGFGLSEITTPVDVWQGDEDTLVPRRYVDILAAGLPAATPHVCRGEGHISLAPNRAGEILRALLG